MQSWSETRTRECFGRKVQWENAGGEHRKCGRKTLDFSRVGKGKQSAQGGKKAQRPQKMQNAIPEWAGGCLLGPWWCNRELGCSFNATPVGQLQQDKLFIWRGVALAAQKGNGHGSASPLVRCQVAGA